MVQVLKVSARSSPNAVAGAIAGILRESREVCVQVIGAAAVNQAVKAIAIARSFVRDDDIEVVCIPTFHTLQVGGEERTALRLQIEDRSFKRSVSLADDVPADADASRSRPAR